MWVGGCGRVQRPGRVWRARFAQTRRGRVLASGGRVFGLGGLCAGAGIRGLTWGFADGDGVFGERWWWVGFGSAVRVVGCLGWVGRFGGLVPGWAVRAGGVPVYLFGGYVGMLGMGAGGGEKGGVNLGLKRRHVCIRNAEPRYPPPGTVVSHPRDTEVSPWPAQPSGPPQTTASAHPLEPLGRSLLRQSLFSAESVS